MTESEAIVLLRRALAQVVPERAAEFEKVAMSATLDELALDSAATIEVVGLLEQELGGEPFADSALSKVRTVGDLLGLVRSAAG